MAELSKYWSVILNAPPGMEFDMPVFHQIFKNLYPFYAIILHDSDIDEVTGNPKIIHCHLVVIRGQRCRFTTLTNELHKWTTLPLNCITVEECICFNKSLRYLIHLDDKDKAPYNPCEVYTNNRGTFENALMTTHDYIDYEYLYNAVLKAGGNKIGIMKLIGIDNYQRYYRVIDTIIQDRSIYSVIKAKNRQKEIPNDEVTDY